MSIKLYLANFLFKFVMKNTTYHGQMLKDTMYILTKFSHIDDESEQPKTDKIVYIEQQCQEFLRKYNLLEFCENKYRNGLIPNPKTEIEEMRIQNGKSEHQSSLGA